jgi:hypothetical protein
VNERSGYSIVVVVWSACIESTEVMSLRGICSSEVGGVCSSEVTGFCSSEVAGICSSEVTVLLVSCARPLSLFTGLVLVGEVERP